MSKFSTGRLVATPGAIEKFTNGEMQIALLCHTSGDWGDVPTEDARMNDQAVEAGSRIISSYNIRGSRLWLITEADRSATTFLLPEEY